MNFRKLKGIKIMVNPFKGTINKVKDSFSSEISPEEQVKADISKREKEVADKLAEERAEIEIGLAIKSAKENVILNSSGDERVIVNRRTGEHVRLNPYEVQALEKLLKE